MNNAAILLFGGGVGFRPVKLLVLIIITIAVLLLLPILIIFSLGAPTLSFLANSPNAKAAEERMLRNYTSKNCLVRNFHATAPAT